MGKVQSRGHRRKVHPTRRTMVEEVWDRQQGTSSPEVEYMGTVSEGAEITSASQSETVPHPTDDPQHGSGIAEPGEDNSLISAGYAHAQASAQSLAYMRHYHEYPGMAANYGYPMYPSSWVYPGVPYPPPVPNTGNRENESHWQGASSTSGSSTKLWRPYADHGATETEITSRKRRAEERSPRRQDPSPAMGAQKATPTADRYWTDAFRNPAISEPAPTVWLDTTILSPACKVREPYDDHVIHLMSSQRVRIGAWRTRSVKTDIHFYFRMHIYGEIRPSYRAMQCHASLVVEVQWVPSIPPDGVMVTVHNASDGTLILRLGDEIAELLVLQALIPKFVLHYAKPTRSNRITPCRPAPRDGEDSTDV